MAQLYSMEWSVAERIAAVHLNVAEDYARLAKFCAERKQTETVNVLLRLAHESEYLTTKIDLDKPAENGRVSLGVTIDQLARETSRYVGSVVDLETIRGDINTIIPDIKSKYPGFDGYDFKKQIAKGKGKVLIFPTTSSQYANRQLKYAQSY